MLSLPTLDDISLGSSAKNSFELTFSLHTSKGEDIHRNLCNDQQDRHHSSSSSSKDHEKDPKSGRNGSVGEQLLGMKKKIVVNHVNIKPKKPDAKSEVNGDDRKIVEDLTQRLGEAEEREKILIKKINELENELKLMKQPSEVEEPQRRLSEAGHKREPSHSAQSSRRPSGENNNFLSPFRRPSDGRVSPSSGIFVVDNRSCETFPLEYPRRCRLMSFNVQQLFGFELKFLSFGCRPTEK